MNLIQNERVKLLATALNNVAVATVVTALIAPAAAFLYGSGHASTNYWWRVGAAWFVIGSAPTCCRATGSWEAQAMTRLQIYLLIAPFSLLALAGGAYWWVVRHT